MQSLLKINQLQILLLTTSKPTFVIPYTRVSMSSQVNIFYLKLSSHSVWHRVVNPGNATVFQNKQKKNVYTYALLTKKVLSISLVKRMIWQRRRSVILRFCFFVEGVTPQVLLQSTFVPWHMLVHTVFQLMVLMLQKPVNVVSALVELPPVFASPEFL